MADIRQIRVGGHKVGINGLDQALAQMPAEMAKASDQEIGGHMLRLLQAGNYFPEAARTNYIQALARECRRHWGQEVAEEQGPGLELKILGAGCPRCHQLYENVIGVVAEMGLTADVEQVTDNKDIAAWGVLTPPGLVIGKEVVAAGRVLDRAKITSLLQAALERPPRS